MQRFCAPTHICHGHRVATGQPVCLPRTSFGHFHCRGMSGCGKTSLDGIALVDQFSQPYVDVHEKRDLIAVFDLGGDLSLFGNAARIAEETGREFQYFIPNKQFDSYSFDPCQVFPYVGSDIDLSQFFLQALQLDHGLDYGGFYYSGQSLGSLMDDIPRLRTLNRTPTIDDIATGLNDPRNCKRFKDADQVRTIFNLLLEYPQLRPHSDPARNIDFARALRDPKGTLIYFWCPTLGKSFVARLIASLALFSLVAIAQFYCERGLPTHFARVFVDEHQEIVGRALAAALCQIRKLHMSLLLFNQSEQQMKSRDLNLASQIFEGTTVKNYHTCVGEDDIKTLQSLFKDKTRLLGGSSAHGLSVSSSSREIIVPGMDRDKILEVSSTFGESFLIVTDHRGFQEPIHIRQEHRYPDLSNQPLPLLPNPPIQTPHPIQLSSASQARRATLHRLLEAKRARERWKLN